TREFWAATTTGRLLLPRCDSCLLVYWYPRPHCPQCHSREITWIESAGRGHVYSYTVIRRGSGLYKDAVPYVLAYVELAEGPRLMTNIVECDPEDVAVDLPVEVVFHDTGHEVALPRFRPLR